ncbi:MAG: hypothetical protein OXC42_08620 [Gammaproteobacteria bacterium]|nr:hypothetical protein [Gammaproteobacteria bacterium]
MGGSPLERLLPPSGVWRWYAEPCTEIDLSHLVMTRVANKELSPYCAPLQDSGKP